MLRYRGKVTNVFALLSDWYNIKTVATTVLSGAIHMHIMFSTSSSGVLDEKQTREATEARCGHPRNNNDKKK